VVPGSDDEVALVRLVDRRYAVEVLDALAGPPLTYRRLRRVLVAHRGQLTEALRALAAHGAIRAHGRCGSWDGPVDANACYELTDIGFGILDLLNRIEVWESIYRRYLDRPL
jgi:DNA-binding HxlR family transcriptional regulator